MVTIEEQRQQLERAREILRQQTIQRTGKTQQELRRATLTSQARERYSTSQQEARQLQAISQQEEVIRQAEQQINEYLKTESGKIQLARELNIQPEPIYGKLGKGYATEVVGYRYILPNGETYEDYSRKEQIRARESQFVSGKEGKVPLPELKEFQELYFEKDLKKVGLGRTQVFTPLGSFEVTKTEVPAEITRAELSQSQIVSDNTSFKPSSITIGNQTFTKTRSAAGSNIPRKETYNIFQKPEYPRIQATGGLLTETIGATSKFLSGEYGFQKAIFPETKRNESLERESLNKAFPPLKLFDVAGSGVVSLGEILGGAKIPEPQRKQTSEQIGDLFKFAAFSPLMKTGSYAQQESEYTEVYNQVTGERRFIKKSELAEMTRLQATSTFQKLSRSEQLKILEQSFSKRAYLDMASYQKDILKARQFLKESGLNEAQITDRLQALKIRAAVKELTSRYQNRMITEEQFKQGMNQLKNQELLLRQRTQQGLSEQFQVFTPVIKSRGALKSIQTTKQSIKPIISFGFEQTPKMNNVGLLGLVSAKEQKTQTKEIQKSIQKSNTLQAQETKQKNIQIFSFKQPQKQIQKQQQDQTSKLVSLSLLGLKVSQAQKTAQTTRTKINEDFGKPQPEKPNKPIPKIPILSPIRNLIKKVKERKETGLFSVFGRRFGKDIKLLETTSKERAEQGLLKFLKGSLGRSGKITKNGEALSFGDLKLFQSREFRPSKKDKARIVQKAEFSLSSYPEKREIQYFKRKSPSKNIHWFD